MARGGSGAARPAARPAAAERCTTCPHGVQCDHGAGTGHHCLPDGAV